jgi:NAD(P)-dependent dehydrogenase (short-subunit alcohol dehydrogenase family)
MTPLLRNRVCLVTGATRGIGHETALGLAQLGARVVLVARDARRGQRVVEEIAMRSGNAAIELLVADLASQRSIRALADAFRRRHARLHVLVNNAGALFPNRSLTVDGIEHTLALNHLGYFLLTELLLDVMRASAPARIVNVASGAHARGRVDFDDLQSLHRYGGLTAYRASKLENLWFTYELARRLAGSGITVNAMHPGTVATRFGLDEPGWFKLVKTLIRPFLRTPEEGAETAVWLASAPELASVSGCYFVDGQERRSSRRSYDRDAQARLWTMSEHLTRRSRLAY